MVERLSVAQNIRVQFSSLTPFMKGNLMTKEWENEPGFVQEVDKKTGYTYFIIRHPHLGNLNGYVRVEKGHPLYGKEDIDSEPDDLRVHGGITFSASLLPRLLAITPEVVDYWYFGFDCAHYDDICPMILEKLAESQGDSWENHIIEGCTYKNINYVRKECKSLAAQLKKIEDTKTIV